MTDAERAHQKAMILRGLQTVSNIKKLVNAPPMDPNAEAPETLCGKKELDEAQAEVAHLRWKLERREAVISDLRREVAVKLLSIRLGASSEVKTQIQSTNKSAEERALELEDKVVMLELRLQDQCAETNYVRQKLADEFERAKIKNEEYQKFVFSSQEKYNEVLRARLVADYALAHQKTVSESHHVAAEGYRAKLRELFKANADQQTHIEGLNREFGASVEKYTAAVALNEQRAERIAELEVECAAQRQEVADTHAKVEQYAVHYDRLVGELDRVVEKMTALEAAAAVREPGRSDSGVQGEGSREGFGGGSGYETDDSSSTGADSGRASSPKAAPKSTAKQPPAALPKPPASPKPTAKGSSASALSATKTGKPRRPADSPRTLTGRAGFLALKPVSMESVAETSGSLSLGGSLASLGEAELGNQGRAAASEKGAPRAKPGLVSTAADSTAAPTAPVPVKGVAVTISDPATPVQSPSPVLVLPSPSELNKLAQVESLRLEVKALAERALAAETRVTELEESARGHAAALEETRAEFLDEIKGLTDELGWKEKALEEAQRAAKRAVEPSAGFRSTSSSPERAETPSGESQSEVARMISGMQSAQGMPTVSSARVGRGPGVPVVYDSHPATADWGRVSVGSPVSFCDSEGLEPSPDRADASADAAPTPSQPSVLADVSISLTVMTDTVHSPPNEEADQSSPGGLQHKIVTFWGSRASSPAGAEHVTRPSVEQCNQMCQTDELEWDKELQARERSASQTVDAAVMTTTSEAAPVPLKIIAALRSVGCNTLPPPKPPATRSRSTMTPAPPPFFADRFLARMSIEFQSLSRRQLPYMSFPELAPDQSPGRMRPGEHAEDDGGRRAVNMRRSRAHHLLSTSAAGAAAAAGTSFSTQAAQVSKSPSPAEVQRRLKSCLGYVEEAARLRNRFILEIPPTEATLQSRNVVRSIDLILQTVAHYLSPCGRRAEEEYPDLFPAAQRPKKDAAPAGASGADTFRLTQPPVGGAGQTPGPIDGLLREHPEWHLNRHELTPQIREDFVANLYEKLFEGAPESVQADAGGVAEGSVEPSLILGDTVEEAAVAEPAREERRRPVTAQESRRPVAAEGGGRPATAGGDAEGLFSVRRLISTQPPVPSSVAPHQHPAGTEPLLRAGAHPTEFFHSLNRQRGTNPKAFNELFDRYYGEILRRERAASVQAVMPAPAPATVAGQGLEGDSMDATYFHSSVEQSFEFNDSNAGEPAPVTRRHNRNNAHCDDFNVGIQPGPQQQQRPHTGTGRANWHGTDAFAATAPAGPGATSVPPGTGLVDTGAGGHAERYLDLAIRPGYKSVAALHAASLRDLDASVLGNSARLDVGSGLDFDADSDPSTVRRALLHSTYMFHEDAGQLQHPRTPVRVVAAPVDGVSVSGINYLNRQRILTANPHSITQPSLGLAPPAAVPVVTAGTLLGEPPAPADRMLFASPVISTQPLLGRHAGREGGSEPGISDTVLIAADGTRTVVRDPQAQPRAPKPGEYFNHNRGSQSLGTNFGAGLSVVARFGGGLEGAAVHAQRTPCKPPVAAGAATPRTPGGWQSGEYNPSVLRDLLNMARQSSPSPQPPQQQARAAGGRGQGPSLGRRPGSTSSPRAQAQAQAEASQLPIASSTRGQQQAPVGSVVTLAADALPQRPKSAYSRMPARK